MFDVSGCRAEEHTKLIRLHNLFTLSPITAEIFAEAFGRGRVTHKRTLPLALALPTILFYDTLTAQELSSLQTEPSSRSFVVKS